MQINNISRLISLHYKTVPLSNEFKEYQTDRALCKRLSKCEHFIKVAKNQNRSFTHIKELIGSYIASSILLNDRIKSKYAHIDTMLQYDLDFIKGYWDIIVSTYTSEHIQQIPVFDIRINDFSDDVINFDLKDFRKEMLKYNKEFVDDRKSQHETIVCFDYAIRAYKCDFLKKQEPVDGFWLYSANILWQRVHYLVKDSILAHLNIASTTAINDIRSQFL